MKDVLVRNGVVTGGYSIYEQTKVLETATSAGPDIIHRTEGASLLEQEMVGDSWDALRNLTSGKVDSLFGDSWLQSVNNILSRTEFLYVKGAAWGSSPSPPC